METCATLVKQGKLEREGMFEFNYSIPSFNTVTCEHRIDAKLSRAYREQLPQRNAFRVETVPLMDRCVLKVPNHWNKASKDRVFADIVNGFILDYGQCSGNCPMCNDERV